MFSFVPFPSHFPSLLMSFPYCILSFHLSLPLLSFHSTSSAFIYLLIICIIIFFHLCYSCYSLPVIHFLLSSLPSPSLVFSASSICSPSPLYLTPPPPASRWAADGRRRCFLTSDTGNISSRRRWMMTPAPRAGGPGAE